ncbi:sensor domain-containing diguanylate cyclase [Leptolyngbya sp. CCY15150]|uniref:GGDEF domain-containing protein n=1 Tax=Leptolyngbya sp. CCY15150 TaxID=2767772 RepID=UPI00194F7A76|nr:sensor domain-containing diguanylate cyclase [Leptolyngbya sp. CCY15150]
MNTTPLEAWLVQAVHEAIAPTALISTLIQTLAEDYGLHASIGIAAADGSTGVHVWAHQQTTDTSSEPHQPALYQGRHADWPQWLSPQVNPSLDPITGDGMIPIAIPAAPAGAATLPQFILRLHRPAPDSDPPTAWADESPQTLAAFTCLARQTYLAYLALLHRHQADQAHRYIALVSGINQLLNSSLDPDQVVDRVMAELGVVMGSNRALLIDFRQASADLLSVWTAPHQSCDLPSLCREDWDLALDALEQGGASYLHFTEPSLDLEDLSDWMSKAGAGSLLIIPVSVQEDLFGAIALLADSPHQTYSVDQLQALRQVANQVAIALVHTQNYLGLCHEPPSPPMPIEVQPLSDRQDSLTHLMTRPCLEQELTHFSNRAMWFVRPPFSLILCDLDYFKLVNDVHGYAIGDEVLCQVAERLRRQLRQGTPAYRYGGEEFAVLLPEAPLSAAIGVAERLRWAISATPIKTSVGALTVTASFGVAQQQPARDRHAMDVLERATRAIAEAKYQGRNCVIGHQLHPANHPPTPDR